MRLTKWLLSTFAALIALTLLFSWLPALASKELAESREVVMYSAAPISRLTSSNIVDVFAGIHWNGQLKSVKWNGSILTVSIKADGRTGRPTEWLADTEKLLRACFLQLENVNRLLIRIVDAEGEAGYMLAAIDVRKSDRWLKEEFEELRFADPIHDEKWRERLRLSFSSTWEERFGVSSSYRRSPLKNE